MKRIAVTWEEVTTYEAVIEVPDDYPETTEAYEDAEGAGAALVKPSGSGEQDWWERVEQQNPDWPTTCCQAVNDRELTNIERVKDAA